ncbi:hypothetical protein CDD82_4302 [Ophiocordyceps australis]|uniref:NmrA-like domain-containing protein n=1 Tax=Ophiocordyceps australis TaxID=1399860 RepID=A0A2C5Z6W3_9HYPO|nr:hypothetical protein CDD82_4302 [Ophiocordyceps australis]
MASSEHTVFVCGATGYQGGALARKLREMGWNVHATTRDLASPAAVALKDIGVQLAECDWDNSAVLRESIKGCDKLYLCLMPDWDDLSREHRQCTNILQIAKEAGVKQVVSSTTLGISLLDAGVPCFAGSFMEKHLISKKAIEQAVEDEGFEHFTLLRPTFFMANFLEPKVKRYSEIRDQRSWTTSMTDETLLPIVDHVDIGKIAAAAFQDPGAFHGRAIGLASELIRLQPMLDLLAEAAGQPGSIRAIFMTDDEVEAQAHSAGFSNTHKLLRMGSDYVNMEELGAIAELTTFEEFLEREKEEVKKTYPMA